MTTKEPTTRLADRVVRDPFRSPPIFDGDHLKPFVRMVIPAERLRETVLFTNRASIPKSVIDAKADANCDGCGELVWMAPSSHRIEGPFTICCLHCLARARGANPELAEL